MNMEKEKAGCLLGKRVLIESQPWKILDSICLFWVESGSHVTYNLLCSWGQPGTPESAISTSQALRLTGVNHFAKLHELTFQKKKFTAHLPVGWVHGHTRDMACLEKAQKLHTSTMPAHCIFPILLSWICILYHKQEKERKGREGERREERTCW